MVEKTKPKKKAVCEYKEIPKEKTRAFILNGHTVLMFNDKKKQVTIAFKRSEFAKVFQEQINQKKKMIGITFEEDEVNAVMTAVLESGMVRAQKMLMAIEKENSDMLYR